MFRFENILDWKVCRSDPNALVVFSDNLIKKGYAGQACIRDEVNSYGVPSKRLPSMFGKEAFFSDTDEEYNIVKEKLTYLWNQHLSGRTIILPKQQIGSGLGRLAQTAPKINALVTRFWDSAMKAKEQQVVYELLDFAEKEPELWEVVKTVNKDKIDYLKEKLNDNTSYYALLISDKSFAYQRFYNQMDMQSALKTPHSPINIQKFALEKVGEKPSFEYGELTDEKFRSIQKILSTQFNQEIVFETIRSAKCSDEAQVLLNHGKPRRNRK